MSLFKCPSCDRTDCISTYRHPFAKVWCSACGHVIREEGAGMPKPTKLTRPQKAMQRVGNTVMNKSGNRQDREAWLKIKDYINALEERRGQLSGALGDVISSFGTSEDDSKKMLHVANDALVEDMKHD